MSPLFLLLLLAVPAPRGRTLPPAAAMAQVVVPVPGAPLVPDPAPQASRRRGRRHAAPSAPRTSAPAAPTARDTRGSPAPEPGPTRSAAAEQLAQAEARYRSALAVTPGIAAYHESLALVLEREGRLQDALASHLEAVRLDTASVRGRTGLGMLLVRLGRSAEAIPHLRAAAAMDASSVDVRKALAGALLEQGHRDEALAALREARQLDSSDSDIERSLKQAEATAPGKDRLNDGTALVDHPVGRAIRRTLEWVFGTLLVVASLALLVPLLSGAVLAAVRMPRGTSRAAA